jgi:hypothetical protein
MDIYRIYFHVVWIRILPRPFFISQYECRIIKIICYQLLPLTLYTFLPTTRSDSLSNNIPKGDPSQQLSHTHFLRTSPKGGSKPPYLPVLRHTDKSKGPNEHTKWVACLYSPFCHVIVNSSHMSASGLAVSHKTTTSLPSSHPQHGCNLLDHSAAQPPLPRVSQNPSYPAIIVPLFHLRTSLYVRRILTVAMSISSSTSLSMPPWRPFNRDKKVRGF